MTSYSVLGVRVDDVSVDDVTALFATWLSGTAQHTVVTPNPEFVLLAQRDAEFRDILNAADLALPDGVGLRFAVSALTDGKLLHRTTGVDTLALLVTMCEARGLRLVTVGSAAADVDAGRVTDRLSEDVVDRVARQAPAVVAVGLGQGKQEKIIARHRASWPTAKIFIGVGGAMDMRAGNKRRAPRLLRNIGLEWVWRLLIEPRRVMRILRAFPVFPAVVVWATLREHRFLKALRRTVPEIFKQITSR